MKKPSIKVHDRVVAPNGEPAIVLSISEHEIATLAYDRRPQCEFGTAVPVKQLSLLAAASD